MEIIDKITENKVNFEDLAIGETFYYIDQFGNKNFCIKVIENSCFDFTNEKLHNRVMEKDLFYYWEQCVPCEAKIIFT